MSFKSLHLANPRSLLEIMEETSQKCRMFILGLALLPSPSKSMGTLKPLGALGKRLHSTAVIQLSICKGEVLSRPQSTLENSHAQKSWLCPYYGSYRSDSDSFRFPWNQEPTSRPARVGKGDVYHVCVVVLPINSLQSS